MVPQQASPPGVERIDAEIRVGARSAETTGDGTSVNGAGAALVDGARQPVPPFPAPAHTSSEPDAEPPSATASGDAAADTPAWLVRWRQTLDGWPAQWPSVRAWLAVGMLRNWRGVGIGMFAAWFNLPFVIAMMGVGGVVGGLTGAVSGTLVGEGVTGRIDLFLKWIFPLPVTAQELLPTAALQIGGILGGLMGAVTGAWRLGWAALTWPWALLYAGDPTWPVAVAVGQVLTSLFVGFLYTLYSIAFEGWRYRVAGARRLSRREAALLLPMMEEVAERLKLRGRPTLLIDDSREVNAYAGARHVVICQGLLDEVAYDPDAIRGVLAHELVHWRDGDSIALTWSKGVALPLYLTFELAVKLTRVTGRIIILQFLIRLLLWSIMATVRYIVIPVQAKGWRDSEFRADQGAVAAGYADGLRLVMTRLRRTFDGSRSGWDRAICTTHPSSELRLERLEQAGQEYPLPDRQAPTPAGRAAPVRVISTLERD